MSGRREPSVITVPKAKKTSEERRADKEARRQRLGAEVFRHRREKYAAFLEMIEQPGFVGWFHKAASVTWSPKYNNPEVGLQVLYELRLRSALLEKYEAENAQPVGENESISASLSANRKRYARLKRATVGWSDPVEIAKVYALRDRLNKEYPRLGPFHVDHVLPLAGKKVSGLHVHPNLVVIPALENFRKGNRIS